MKQFLKLENEEKDFLERIVAFSCIDEKVVKEVLQAILKMISIEQYSESDLVYIPYICSIQISSFEKITDKGVETIIELNAQPSKHLIKEIKAINEGEILPTQDHIRQNIYQHIEKIVLK